MIRQLLTLLTLCVFQFTSAQCVPEDIYAIEDANAVCIEVVDNVRMIYSNNYPDHDDDYNQPMFDVTAGEYEYSMCAYPEEAGTFTPLYEETETSVGCTYTYTFGVSINGVKYDPNSAVTFINDDDGDGENDDSNNLGWHVEASSEHNSIGANMGTENGGHLNPFGEYHYHVVPTDYFVNDLGIDGSEHSALVGWAADGFPIYYKYVYSDPDDATSAIVTANSGYSLRSGSRGGDGDTDPDGTYNGEYYEDYEYDESTTILDECNGRYGVTPEFEYGTYYYVITDEYPYIPRCFKGTELDNTFRVGPSASCGDSDASTNCAAEVEGCMDPFSVNYNPSANVDDGSCVYTSNTITWDGDSWDNSSGPESTDAVVISGDYQFSINGAFNCVDLTVSSGATLTVDGENPLTVNGDIDVTAGSIVVESGASLITYESNAITGDAFLFKRNTRYADGKYSFVGTPVVQSADIAGLDLGSVVYRYNETTAYAPNAGLSRWEEASADELIPGKGYAQAFKQEMAFAGPPNEGTITLTGTFTDLTNSNPEGWNLVANPYPAAISVADFLAENENLVGSVYIWDDNNSASVRGSNDDYIIANGITATDNSLAGNSDRYNNHLGSCQGFFVKLLDNTDLDISFTEAMRVTDSNSDDNFFRKTEREIPYIRLNLLNEAGDFKQMVVGWVDGVDDSKTNRMYDAPVFDSNAEFLIYSLKGDNSLAIQGVSEQVEQIRLGMNIAETGSYTLRLDLENYSSGQNWMIYDKQLSQTSQFENGEYHFHSVSGKIDNRFSLVVVSRVLAGSNEIQALVYAARKTLYTRYSGQTERNLHLYNLSGRRMESFLARGSTSFDLSHLPAGVYIISDGASSKKLSIR